MSIHIYLMCCTGVTDLRVVVLRYRRALVVMFLIFPMVSQTIFQCFSCVFLDASEQWLYIDHQISCNDTNYQTFRSTLGVLGILIYVSQRFSVPL